MSRRKGPLRPGQYNVVVPPETLEEWRAYAEASGENLSAVIRKAMDAYIGADDTARLAALGREVARLVKST